MLSLSVHKKLDYSTPVVFVPLGTQTTTKPTSTKNIPKKTTITPVKQIVQKKDSIVAPTKPTTIATTTPKSTTKTITAVAAVKKIESSVAKAMADTPAIKADVKVDPPKETITPKLEKPNSAKASSVAKAEDTSKGTSAIKADVKEIIPSIAQALDTEQVVVPIIPENAQISHNYRQVEALRMQAQLQKEIVQKWKPPIGVSPDCMCDMSFFVNTTGAIENVKMTKPSGVVMFDISVRQALCAIKMPHWTYGKTLTINFKQ